MKVPPLLNNRYKTGDEIGHGAMGVVIKAYDPVLEADVAIKIVSDTSNRLALERFEREWKILKDVLHPAIVKISDRGEFRDGTTVRPFFVMPLLQGETFHDLIYSPGERLDVKRVVNIICALCGGLQAAHNRGVIHRDIKPSNIFILEGDAVQIIDFGVAHFEDTTTLTSTRGTAPYIAPELVTPGNRQQPSPQSDIFSVAVCCYEALTRVQPFDRGDDNRAVLQALLRDMPQPISELNGDVNLAVSAVIQRAMAKKPEHRHASALDFAERLQTALRNETIIEFDEEAIMARLGVVSDACDSRQFRHADELLRAIQAEGIIDKELSRLRRRVDQGLHRGEAEDLIEGARFHRQAQQYADALSKLQDVLRINPLDVDLEATAESLKAQIESEWVQNCQQAARKHIRAREFVKARQELGESQKIRPKDTLTLDLIVQLENLEQAGQRTLERKATLYREAQKAHRDGEFATALNRLEKISSLSRASTVSGQYETVYESFHQEVLAEWNKLQGAADECYRLLDVGKLAQARTICDQMLVAYPGQPLFSTFKLELEERQRQTTLDYITELESRLKAIVDLESRVSVAQEADGYFQTESQVQEMLRNAKGRRDLVASIVAYARKAEERGDFSEALYRWGIVKRCHPLFPGLAAQIERVKKRDEDQIRTEVKSQHLENLEDLIRSGQYQVAKDLCDDVLTHFPQDRELLQVRDAASDRLAKSAEAERLAAVGRHLLTSGSIDEALQVLRQAHDADSQRQSVRQILGDAMLKKAQDVFERDTTVAEQLVREASKLIPDDADLKNLMTLISDRRQREFVDDCLSKVRSLALSNDPIGALKRVRDGRGFYPQDRRLKTEEEKLVKTLRDAGHRVESATEILPTMHSTQIELQNRAELTAGISLDDYVRSDATPTARTPEISNSSTVGTSAGKTLEQLWKRIAKVLATWLSVVRQQGSSLKMRLASWTAVTRAALTRKRPAAAGQRVSMADGDDSRQPAPRSWKSYLFHWRFGVLGILLVVSVATLLVWSRSQRLVPVERAVGTAVVLNAGDLVEQARLESKRVMNLPGGRRVNILERPKRDQTLVRVQVVSPRWNSRPGYFPIAALGDWDSSLAWERAQFERPVQSADESEWRRFAQLLDEFSSQYRGHPEVIQADLERAKLYVRFAATGKNVDKPELDWRSDLDKARKALPNLPQDNPEALSLLDEIRNIDVPKNDPNKVSAKEMQLRKLEAQAESAFSLGDWERLRPIADQMVKVDPLDSRGRWWLKIMPN